ncbi:MAG: hypothetical protein U0Y96_12975 [Candidatus Kapaibacterium sp.]|nr:hypothetical protein [Bacteroidota bacterium]
MKFIYYLFLLFFCLLFTSSISQALINDTTNLKVIAHTGADKIRLYLFTGIGSNQGNRIGLNAEYNNYRVGCAVGGGFKTLAYLFGSGDAEYVYSGFVEAPFILYPKFNIGCSYSYRVLGNNNKDLRGNLGMYFIVNILLSRYFIFSFGAGYDRLVFSQPEYMGSKYLNNLHLDIKLNFKLY